MSSVDPLHPDLAAALAAAEARYRDRHPGSLERHRFAVLHMPGGHTRSALYYAPFPLTFASGHGNRLTDVDGRSYLDLLGDYSAGLYGHSNAIIEAAIKLAVADGLALGGPNVYEARLAEAIRARFASMDLIRFTNSGTEANLMALAAVRARSPERPKFVVFDGAYHGGVFDFRYGGSSLNLPYDWLVGTYNDVEGTRALLRGNCGAVGAVLVEPLQGGACIPGTPEFLRMLREECSACGMTLVFDEVMTSRLGPSGLQGALGIRPDMTTLGKYLGGGAGFGAFGGRRDIMAQFDPSQANSIALAGTFNNNVISMAAGLAGLTQVLTPAAIERLNALGGRLRARLNEAAAARGAPFAATGSGSLIGLHPAGIDSGGRAGPRDAAAARARRMLEDLFHLDLLDRGFYFSRRGYAALSLPTTPADCEDFAAAVEEFMSERQPLIRHHFGLAPPVYVT